MTKGEGAWRGAKGGAWRGSLGEPGGAQMEPGGAWGELSGAHIAWLSPGEQMEHKGAQGSPEEPREVWGRIWSTRESRGTQ